jgi:uncharacterized membrane protein
MVRDPPTTKVLEFVRPLSELPVNKLVSAHVMERSVRKTRRPSLTYSENPGGNLDLGPTARVAGHPIHPMLVPVPIVCFVGALVTDIAYAASGDIMWSNFSAWLIVVGLIVGVLAAIAGLTDFLGNPQVRLRGPAWPHVLGNLVVLVLSCFNALVHSRDAWTSVVPTGLVLSVIVVLILPVTGWLGWSMVYRYGVGVER